MGRQLQNVQEMHDHFTEEQHRFYSEYFKRYNIYLSFLTPPSEPQKIQDENLYKTFENALLDEQPNWLYKHEPWRYTFYHILFKCSPVPLRDYFITKFMQMPQYNPAISMEEDFEEIGD